ncbi:hypothetical protein ACPXCO_23890 [Streptomyces cyaneofuscatus]|uniref:hypothetical protein n=1 Tax=Streptomyces cyaneofuscatus TaxID=66883 RepID=UPI003CEA1009
MTRRPGPVTAAFAGHRFHIRTDDTFLIEQRGHLLSFAPYPDSAAPCGQHTEIRVRHSADLFHDRMARLRTAPSRQVTPFRGEPYLLTNLGGVCWWRPHPEHLPQDHLYAKDAAGGLHVVLDPGADRGERYLMRVIREVVLRCAENRGWALFHAAAAVVDEHGVLIAGPSGAGKTTVLTALAAHRRAHLVASDRAAVIEGAHSVVGVPISVRMARGTLAAIAPHENLPPHELLPASFGTTRKAACTPWDFARAFAARVRGSAPLSLLVLPQLSDDRREVHAEFLPAEMARDLLAAVCCTPHDEDWQHPWFADRTRSLDSLSGQAADVVRDLVAKVPVIAVSAGVHTPQLLERLADAVTRRLT